MLTQADVNKRGEIKLTATVSQGQTIRGGYLNNPTTVSNDSGLQSFVIDPKSESTVNDPNWYYFTNYKGVLTNNLFVEAQYSKRHLALGQTGPSGTGILNSPVSQQHREHRFYNAPASFDARRTRKEIANNQQVTGSLTNYWNKERPSRDQRAATG